MANDIRYRLIEQSRAAKASGMCRGMELDQAYEVALSVIPSEDYSIGEIRELVNDVNFIKELHRGLGSMFISAIINSVIRPYDELVICRSTTESIGFYSTALYDLGIFLPCGTLCIEGSIRGRQGYKMKGGKIVISGNFEGELGRRMKDGLIFFEGQLESADQNSIGYKMKGGVIDLLQDVEGCGQGVGTEMRGGRIHVRGNAYSVGKEMRGGEIMVEGVTSEVGWIMTGGSLYIEEVEERGSIGYGMAGGKINIRSSREANIGGYMEGGRIAVLGDTQGNIGTEMSGGGIIVRGSCVGGSVGQGISGGCILVTGDVTSGSIGLSLFRAKKDRAIIVKGSVAENVKVCDYHDGTVTLGDVVLDKWKYAQSRRPSSLVVISSIVAFGVFAAVFGSYLAWLCFSSFRVSPLQWLNVSGLGLSLVMIGISIMVPQGISNWLNHESLGSEESGDRSIFAAARDNLLFYGGMLVVIGLLWGFIDLIKSLIEFLAWS